MIGPFRACVDMRKSGIRTKLLLAALAVALVAGAVVARRGSRVARAREGVLELSRAITAYTVVYGTLPFATHTPIEDQDNEVLLDILSCRSNAMAAITYNPKRVKFINDSGRRGPLLDPWGRPYHICLDHDGDGYVRIAKERFKRSHIVWSDGPNMKNEFGNGDDIASWKIPN